MKNNVQCNFIQCYSILSYIPQTLKKLLQEGSKDPVTPPTPNGSLTFNTVCSMLLSPEDLPPPTSKKNNIKKQQQQQQQQNVLQLASSEGRKVTWLKYTFYHSKPQKK